MSLFACAACALGLLLWARLLLVSHPPRVATAEPAPATPTVAVAPAQKQPKKPDDLKKTGEQEPEPPVEPAPSADR
jgi:hypothetical protein